MSCCPTEPCFSSLSKPSVMYVVHNLVGTESLFKANESSWLLHQPSSAFDYSLRRRKVSPLMGAEVGMALLRHPGALLPVAFWNTPKRRHPSGGGRLQCLSPETRSQNYATRSRFLNLEGVKGPLGKSRESCCLCPH